RAFGPDRFHADSRSHHIDCDDFAADSARTQANILNTRFRLLRLTVSTHPGWERHPYTMSNSWRWNRETQTSVAIVYPSLLPKRRHWKRYIIGLGTGSYPTFTGIWWSCADTPRPLTFSRPKHVPEHPACCSGAVGGDCLNKVPGRIRHRTGEINAFRSGFSTGNDIKTSSEFSRSQRQNWRAKLRFAVDMFLPVADCPDCAGLTIRHHRIGIIQNRCGSVEPISRRFASNINQPAIARGQVYRQPSGMIITGRVIGED